jgi:hypothetical protein
MLTPAHRFLVVLNLSIVALGCYDGEDLVKTDAHPAFVPPDIHGASDTGVHHAVTPGPFVPFVQPGAPQVERVSSAIIGTGMRSCDSGAPGGGPQIGEVVIMNQAVQFPTWDPGHCLVLGHNGWWANLHSPMHNWYTGDQLPDDIKHAQYYVPPGFCVGFKPYVDPSFVGAYSFVGSWVCKATWQLGENWRLWSSGWQISSMKTAYVYCPNGGCSPPGDW